jgi:hypothetical protein
VSLERLRFFVDAWDEASAAPGTAGQRGLKAFARLRHSKFFAAKEG